MMNCLSSITLKWHCVARDIAGAEGPCFDRRGRLFCVSSDRGTVLRLDDERSGHMTEHVHTGGIPAGLARAPDGSIFVADMARGVLAIDPDRPGACREIVSTFGGKPIRGCNDLCFDPVSGDCFFTAPAGSWDVAVGELFHRKSDGSVRRIDDGFRFCNGVALSPGRDRLVVAETQSRKLWAYDLTHSSPRIHWADLPASDEVGGPDGLDFSPCGRYLLAAHWSAGAIELFCASDGRQLGRIPTPFARPSNLEFSADARSLWVTEHSTMSLWRADWDGKSLSSIIKSHYEQQP